jgi:hypothetical protein
MQAERAATGLASQDTRKENGTRKTPEGAFHFG